MSTLDDWIRKDLTVDIEKELSKYKEKVKPLISLTPSGEVLIKRNDLSATQKVLIYLIGKTYANIVNYSEETVTNKELEDALHLPEGTVRNSLFRLRKDDLVLSVKGGVHKAKVATLGIAFDKYFPEANQS